MEAQDFIDIFLSGFVSQAFDVVNMHSDELRIDVFLDEKKRLKLKNRLEAQITQKV